MKPSSVRSGLVSAFEYPDVIDSRMEEIFETHAHLAAGDQVSEQVSAQEFSHQAAQLMHHLNDVHPFREGNGRTQRVFLERLGAQAGHHIEQANIDAKLWVNGAMQSFVQGGKKDNPLLVECISTAIELSRPSEMDVRMDHDPTLVGDAHGGADLDHGIHNDGHDDGRGGR